MFKLTVWTRSFDEVGTVVRPTAGELLDIGKGLQESHGAYYRLEFISDEDRKEEVCTDCGKTCRQCC